MKQKLKEEGNVLSDKEIMHIVLETKNYKPEHLICSITASKVLEVDIPKQSKPNKPVKHLLPSLESICERPFKK